VGKTDKALKPRGARWGRRALPGVLVLALVAAAAAVVLPAAATGSSRHNQIRPKNQIRPQIVGKPRVGVTLKAKPGAWTSVGHLVYRYRWLRCPAGGTKCTRITGAVSRRYTPVSRDVSTTLRVAVAAANATGSARATSRPTSAVREGANARLAALWHMDETSGTVMNDSAGADNGTLHSTQIGLAGSTRMSYGFDGHTSYVSVPSASHLNPGSANIILTIHLKTTSAPKKPPADFDLIRKGTYAPYASEYKIELQHSGQASCGFEGTAGYSELIAGPRLNDGKWHRVQCIKAPTAIQLVVDGKTFTQPANVGSITNTAPLVIGARPDGDYYSGDLDEVSIHIG
jgi:hypothetical protein